MRLTVRVDAPLQRYDAFLGFTDELNLREVPMNETTRNRYKAMGRQLAGNRLDIPIIAWWTNTKVLSEPPPPLQFILMH